MTFSFTLSTYASTYHGYLLIYFTFIVKPMNCFMNFTPPFAVNYGFFLSVDLADPSKLDPSYQFVHI